MAKLTIRDYTKRGFQSKDEFMTYIVLCQYLNGWRKGDKINAYARKMMTKRRQQGKTQKASRDYIARNKLACAMYNDFMNLEPSLVRKRK